MKRAIGIFGVIAVIIRLSGMDLSIVQAVAWAEMIDQRSGEVSLQIAVEEALSGSKPCSRCNQIKEERQKRDKSTPINDNFKEMKLSVNPENSLKSLSFPKESHLADFSPFLLISLAQVNVIIPPPQTVS